MFSLCEGHPACISQSTIIIEFSQFPLKSVVEYLGVLSIFSYYQLLSNVHMEWLLRIPC